MRDRILNALILFTAFLWAVWFVTWSASALQNPRAVASGAWPILGVGLLVGCFLLVYRADTRPRGLPKT